MYMEGPRAGANRLAGEKEFFFCGWEGKMRRMWIVNRGSRETSLGC